MGVREIVLALVILAAVLGLVAAQATADDSAPPVVCVSAVGPVDATGHGDTVPVESGDCP